LAVILLVGPHVVRSTENLKPKTLKDGTPFMTEPNDSAKSVEYITTEEKVTEEPSESTSPGHGTMNRELGTENVTEEPTESTSPGHGTMNRELGTMNRELGNNYIIDEDSEEASPLVEDTSEEPTSAYLIESEALSRSLGMRPHRGWGPYGYPPPGFTSGGRDPQWDRNGDKNPKLNRLTKCLGHPEKPQLLKVMKDIKKWIKMLDHDILTSESPKSTEDLSRVNLKLPYRERALKKIADLILGKQGLLSSSPYGSFEFRSREEDHHQDKMEHGHNKHDIHKMWCLFEAFKYEDSVGMKDMLLALQQRIAADKTLLRNIYQRRKNQVKLMKSATQKLT